MQPTIEQAFKQAVAAHKAGALNEAEKIYRAILQSQPNHPDANHNLGVVAVSLNQIEAALPFFKAALDANPNVEPFWLSYVNALVKADRLKDAKQAIKKARKKGFDAKKLGKLVFESKRETENSAEVHYNLGNRLLGLGRLNEAEASYNQAIALRPDFADAHNNLGLTLQRLGRLDEAEATFNQAIALKPYYAGSIYNLGNVLKALGRLSEAEASYNQAIALKPDYADGHFNLGNTLLGLGKLKEAEQSYNRTIALRPEFAEAHNNLGGALQGLGRLSEAEASYNQAIALKPDYAEAHNNLGGALQVLSRLSKAEASYNRAIALKPDFADAHNNLGITLQGLGRLNEAEASYNQAIALRPDFADAHNNLGLTLQRLGRLDEAKATYKQAIALQPDHAKAHNNLGNVLTAQGSLSQAEASYDQAIALQPDFAKAYRHLTQIKKLDRRDERFLKMLELDRKNVLSDEDHCHIQFGLAKVHEDLGDVTRAFTHYVRGNELRKKSLGYDALEDVELFRQLKANYPKIAQTSFEPKISLEEPTPIFIVGMPRSGTTLVEQIVSSHPLVTGAGELPHVDLFGSAMAVKCSDVTSDGLLRFRKCYLDALRGYSQGNTWVTDKMPHNFRYLGLLAKALPEAKFIHVRRRPEATCWGNFKTYFSKNRLGYAWSIEDIVAYFNLYQSLMEFWGHALNHRIYNLDYELLTDDQEPQTRKLIDFIGLNWDEICLSPEGNTRDVSTSSNMQVRQKVYRGSSEQWKKYEPFLDGAFEALSSSYRTH